MKFFQTRSVNLDYMDTVDNVLTAEQPKGSPSARGRWPHVGKLGSIRHAAGGCLCPFLRPTRSVWTCSPGRGRGL